ncbi:hypothetical protein pb186bvf_014072 [Paramecium bursaria]
MIQTQNLLPQKQILKELEQTLFMVQRTKEQKLKMPEFNQSSNQSQLLREIDYFCQKLTTVKKKPKSPVPVETKQFLFTQPENLQQRTEPDQRSSTPPTPQKNIPSKAIKKQEPVKTVQTDQKKKKLIIKQLKFVREEPISWIPVKAQQKMIQIGDRLALGLAIFWSEEDLAQLQVSDMNLLTVVEQIKSQGLNSQLNGFLLRQLRVYGIIVNNDLIMGIRETYVRFNEVKIELNRETTHERRKKMLKIEQNRIIKKIYLKYVQLLNRYSQSIITVLKDVENIKINTKKQQVFKAFNEYRRYQKEKREFLWLARDDLNAKIRKRLFLAFKRTINQEKSIKLLIVKQFFRIWYKKNERKSYYQSPSKDQEIEEFLSDEKSNRVSLRYSHRKITQYKGQQTIEDFQLQFSKINREIDYYKNNFKSTYHLGNFFYRWRISWLNQNKFRVIETILKFSKIKKIFNKMKGLSNIYKKNLKIKVFKALIQNTNQIRQFRQEENLERQKLDEQRQLIEQMALEVYEMNLRKKAFIGWKNQSVNQQIKEVWQHLSEEKQNQDSILFQLRCERTIQLRMKQRFFNRWMNVYERSQNTVELLQECEQRAKNQIYEQLIRIAFESSLKSQFRKLEYK